MRIEPPWSPPIAISTSPAPTSAPEPETSRRPNSRCCTGCAPGPIAEVWLPPERQKYSQCALPTIVPPASRMRVTTVASTSGT